MSLDLTYPHVEKPPGEPARLLRLPRIRVAQIAMDYLAHGWSAEEMCRNHPGLQLGEVHAALAYYFDHQEEIDAEIRSELDELKCMPTSPSPFYTRMRAKGLI